MQVIQQEMKQLHIQALLITFIGIIALGISCYTISTNTVICFPIEIWVHGCTVVDFFLPLLVTVPFSVSLFMKRKDGFIEYAAIRISKKKYIVCQIVSGKILCAIVTFVIYFGALLLSRFVFFEGSSTDRDYIYEYVFGKYQAETPIMFGVLWCMWKGAIASLFTGFGCMLALYVDNVFVVAILPFIYVMAENLVTGILGIPEYGIMTSYVLNRLTPEVMSVWNYIVGVISYIVITGGIILVLKVIRGLLYEENYSY